MIDINIHNYEEYVIDYLEGKLASEEEDAFVNFLIDHPAIAEEIEGLDEITLPKAEKAQSFPGKQALLKETVKGHDTSLHFDDLCVAKLEGDLSRAEEAEFDIMLDEDPQKARAFAHYKKTILKPDRRIQFPAKGKLKKQAFYRNRNLVWLSAAASLALLISLFFITGEDFSTTDNLDVQKIASVQKQQEEQVEPEKEIKRETRGTNNTKTREQTSKKNSINESKIEVNNKLSKGVDKEENRETDKTTDEKNLILRESASETLETLELLAESRPGPLQLDNESPRPALKTNIRTTAYLHEKHEDALNTVTKTAVQGINKIVFNKEKEHPASEKISLWDIAGLGVKGINRLTGTEMELKKSYDEEGNVKALAFNSKAISFTHKKGQ